MGGGGRCQEVLSETIFTSISEHNLVSFIRFRGVLKLTYILPRHTAVNLLAIVLRGQDTR
jgi:hypothetical protein